MSLYRKYRPKKLNMLRGRKNRETVNSLRTILNRPRKDIPHTYLITGPTGCGKTTIGRIIREKLDCADYDYKEVDSADFRGIDTIREIRTQLPYSPMAGRCRVWLLDECHKLSNDAQNALLKALENPPDHVYFILCTTNPEKLLKTIRGRCLPLQVFLLEEHEISRLLRIIAKKEKKKVKKETIEQIALDSLGHPRNALQLLDKIIDLPLEKQLEAARIVAEQHNRIIELCRALMKKKSWKTISKILKGISSEDPEKIRRSVLGYCNSVLLSSDNALAYLIMEAFEEPMWNIGFPGITLACYRILNG